ncbi:complex I subunit 4 family protein [Methyloglobulus sp.]|uniref:complex I subunit 4 family protein n=1 Tax=Methyloglobulus sp. TaxID=2518622 RepID=UPI0039896181
MLTTLTIIPVAAMFAVLTSRSVVMTMRLGYAATLLNAALSFYLLSVFDNDKPGVQLAEQASWLGLSYSVGVDGLNILFFPLITCLALLVLVYVSATRLSGNSKLVAGILAYEAILIGAFSALNVLQFWILTVLELVTVIALTTESALDQKKRHLIITLVQFFGSSLFLTLCGFLLLAFGLIDSEHDLTFDLLTLKNNNAYLHDETLIFILLFYGFAIRMPLFPFHGWLPLLVEQGGLTGIVVFIVGLKLGVYATVRFIFPLVPGVAEQWAGFVLLLCLISIFYGALLAFMQNNIYRLLAFATISHTGVLVLGIFSFNEHGLEGALLLSLVYGLASVGMIFSISLINEQTRTVMIPRLGNLFDSHATLALLFLITALSTLIMPGSLGFDAGHLLVEGVIDEHEWGVAVTILIGNVLAAGFLLWAFQRIFLAKSKRHIAYLRNSKTHFQERFIAIVICGLHIGTGLNSMPLFNLIDKDVIDLVSQYPMHSTQQYEEGPPVNNDSGEDKDAH